MIVKLNPKVLRKAQFAVLLSSLAASLTGCKREGIEVYTVPRESDQPVMAAAASGHADNLGWKLPDGWKQVSGSSMRYASFEVTGKDGHKGDVSITMLPVSDELINVNRWRGQLGLAPVEAAQLSATGQDIQVGDSKGRLHSLAADQPSAEKGYTEGMLAAFVEHAGQMWFFKLAGEKELVAGEKERFAGFLNSIDFHGDGGHAAPPATAASSSELPPGHPPMGKATPPSSAGQSRMPQWQVPAGWESDKPGMMVLVAFRAGGAKVAVNPPFGASFGGILPNLNRWRGQVSLPPVEEADLSKHLGKLDLGGTEAIVADMTGQDTETGAAERLIVAIVPNGDQNWFYKIKGPAAEVAAQKEAFEAFVKSAKY